MTDFPRLCRLALDLLYVIQRDFNPRRPGRLQRELVEVPVQSDSAGISRDERMLYVEPILFMAKGFHAYEVSDCFYGDRT